jgi:transposase
MEFSATAFRESFCQAELALNERSRRLVAAVLVRSLGHGGLLRVSQMTGIARSTLGRALKELDELPTEPPAAQGRIRKAGGGRKNRRASDPTLVAALEKLIAPETRGDPESPLLWTLKSTRELAAALVAQGHTVSHETVRGLLRFLGYSLQATRKTKEGADHPDRNAQFEFINAQAEKFMQCGQPVISVDTKKKELVGDFANGGQEWQPQGEPVEVRTHDFPDKELGKVSPYGVYDLAADEGWVSVGIDHDTADFAAATIQRWWEEMGSQRYPKAQHLMITADGGGSNSSRGRLWKVALQRLADTTGLRLWVHHYPPGTSKWNKIEHRLFSWITRNWRGRPLLSHAVIVSLIQGTKTRTGLHVRAELDTRSYPTGKKVTRDELAEVRHLLQVKFGDWNYVILPKQDMPEPNRSLIL